MHETIVLVILVTLVWYWWDTSTCNDLARRQCQHLCRSSEVQLLDATVNRQRSWLRRSPRGGIQICRLYSFAWSDDSESRQHGYIVLLGHQVAEQTLQRTAH